MKKVRKKHIAPPATAAEIYRTLRISKKKRAAVAKLLDRLMPMNPKT